MAEKQDQRGSAASDDAKRLWGLADLIQGQMMPLAEEHDKFCDGNCDTLSEDDQEHHRILMTKANHIKIERELVMDIFWKTVRLEFPEIISKGQIGLAENGQVYWETNGHSCNLGIGIFEIISISPYEPMPANMDDIFGQG